MQSKYDICASTASSRTDTHPILKKNNTGQNWVGGAISCGICHSYTPDGRCVSLFKVLYTNRCIYNCKYCFTQSCKQKMSFTPQEYADTFMKLNTMNVTEGLFLSSAVCGNADETTKEMLETLRIIRFKYNFLGYVHFKILPGTSAGLIKEAMQLSDRLSVNLEAPTKEHLGDIAEQKDYDRDILTRQRWIKEIRNYQNREAEKAIEDYQADYPDRNITFYNKQMQNYCSNNNKKSQIRFIPRKRTEWVDENGNERHRNGYQKIRWDDAPILTSGQTTQFILGAAGESDWDLLKRLDWEYREIDLRRGYFSAFSPVKNTPFEEKPKTPLDREHRLYQTDWLLRIYRFGLKEVKDILNNDYNLPKGDPKIHLARVYFEDNACVDINTATYEELLRVPGLGPLSAKRILDLRANKQLITSRAQLHQIGVILKRADPFLLINGQHQRNLHSFLKA